MKLTGFSFFLLSAEGSATESDDDNERVDGVEDETDEDENTFFDTRDFLSSSSLKSNGSDFRSSSFSSDEESLQIVEPENDIDASIRFVGTNYPYIKRRKKLPDPVEKEKGVSLWAMIKDNIGKDLTKICLPVYFNEPLSSLQKCFEELEYSYLIDRAYEWGKRVGTWLKNLVVFLDSDLLPSCTTMHTRPCTYIQLYNHTGNTSILCNSNNRLLHGSYFCKASDFCSYLICIELGFHCGRWACCSVL